MRTAQFALILSCLIALPSAAADKNFLDEVVWVPSIGLQAKTLEFEQTYTSGSVVRAGSGDVEVTMPVLSVGLAASYKKFGLAIQYEDTFIGNSVSEFSDVPFTESETDIDRRDFNISLTYNVWEQINVAVGYLDGETELRPDPLCIDLVNAPRCALGTANVPDGNLSYEHAIRGLPAYSQTYSEDGFYFGGNYGLPIKDIGALSFTLVYANLDAEYKDNFLPDTPGNQFKFKGDSDGLSASVTWSQQLTPNYGYFASAKYQSFDMDADSSNGNFVGDSVDTEETMTTLTVGLRFIF